MNNEPRSLHVEKVPNAKILNNHWGIELRQSGIEYRNTKKRYNKGTSTITLEPHDLAFLWMEYKKEHPNGYQLSQFYTTTGIF